MWARYLAREANREIHYEACYPHPQDRLGCHYRLIRHVCLRVRPGQEVHLVVFFEQLELVHATGALHLHAAGFHLYATCALHLYAACFHLHPTGTFHLHPAARAFHLYAAGIHVEHDALDLHPALFELVDIDLPSFDAVEFHVDVPSVKLDQLDWIEWIVLSPHPLGIHHRNIADDGIHRIDRFDQRRSPDRNHACDELHPRHPLCAA
jgi:hypothetical protein